MKMIGNTTLTTFSIANNHNYTSNGEKKEETLFLDCVVWGKLGESVVMAYCKKGKQVAVSGRLRLNSWQNQEGKRQSKIELIVDKLEMLGGQGNSNRPPDSSYTPPDGPPGQNVGNQTLAGEESQVGPEEFTEDDIPF